MIFLQKYWHLIVIAVLAIALLIMYEHSQNVTMIAESRGSIIKEKDAEITYRETEKGLIIADKIAAETKASEIQEAYPLLARKLDEMDIRMKALRTSIQAEFRALNSGTSTIIRDTIFKAGQPIAMVDSIKINDGYLNFKGQIGKELNWKYTYQDSITIALHVKKKWFLGKETLHSSFMLQNPNARVVNSTSVQVSEHRDKRWVISAGVSYDPFSGKVVPAIHAGFAILKF